MLVLAHPATTKLNPPACLAIVCIVHLLHLSPGLLLPQAAVGIMSSPIPSPTTSSALAAAMDPPMRAIIFVAVVTIHALLLVKLGSRRRCSRHPALRFMLWSLSVAYLPLMSYVLSYMTASLWKLDSYYQVWLLVSLVLVQFLKAKADMEALAVAAVASPIAGDDDINSLKVRPSMESLIYSFWVAGLVIYNIFFGKDKKLLAIILPVSPLWALGACRMVLKFVAFHRATSSFALGRNVQLIHGYMVEIQEAADFPGADSSAVPPLIVTGERKQDIEESSLGYRIKRSALEAEPSSLVTLDRVWSESESLLVPQLKDLCLSFALFKCLRRRFAGYPLAEAGSSWAFRFVRDGLLGREDDHERIFRAIASELTFASDFYYSPLPVASLGSQYAGLHFLLSTLIFSCLCLLLLFLIVLNLLLSLFDDINGGSPMNEKQAYYIVPKLPVLLAVVIAWMEMSEMLTSVRSNWTKISIVGHYIRCRNRRLRKIFTCLLGRCKASKQWKDEIGQVDLLSNASLLGNNQRSSCARLFIKMKTSFVGRQNPVIKVPAAAKAAILTSFRISGGQLSAGTEAVQRRSQAFCHDITWACLGGEAVTTTTDAILVWCVATGLFEKRCSFRKTPLCSSKQATTSMGVALCLSRYCAYLMSEVPDLLPDSPAWTRRRYQEVKEGVEAALLRGGCGDSDMEVGAYGQLADSLGGERSHEVLKRGSRLAKQLVDEAEKQRSSEEGEAAGAREGEDAVWELLAEFWSEMLLYVSPSDNVKGHIEVLQRGGELITLLWVLLLHAGITSRPARPHVPHA